jgi:hypothetical protein
VRLSALLTRTTYSCDPCAFTPPTQVALYCRPDGIELYHKADLARACADVCGFDEDGLLWLLFRGVRGKPDAALDMLQRLVDHVEHMYRESVSTAVELVWTPLLLPDDSWRPEEGIDPHLFDMFRANPIECTPEFATRFHLIHGETSAKLRAVFSRSNSPAKDIPELLRPLHRDVIQGGDAWHALQLCYNAHSSSGASPASHPLGFAAQHYCVVRGCALEALACEAIVRAHPRERVLQLGMLVDEVTCEAISPDAVVCSEHDKNAIIVYEIKGVFGAKGSAHYHRAMWLSTRQLTRAARMIRRTGLTVTCRVIIVYVTEVGSLHAEQTSLLV